MLSGRGILVKPPEPRLLSRFFLLATKLARWREERSAALLLLPRTQAEPRQEAAEIRWQGFTTSRRHTRSRAAGEAFSWSQESETSQRRMLLMVSSSESSMKGDIPLRRM